MNLRGGRTGTLPGLPAPARLAGAPRIWAVGGGKGGVGKSLVASSLACAMAGAGRRCAVVDADLGGANLHTLLGVPAPRRTLSHFLGGQVKSLAELLVPTSVPNLSLVGANRALLDMANPKHAQKEKLFRHVRGLDVDEVVIDLGGGSAFNALDTFLVARRGLVVITPEPTAIENAEHFLAAAFFRSLRIVARRPEVRGPVLRVQEDKSLPRLASAGELIARVRAIDPPAAKLLAECAEAFAPLLLVNQAESGEHERIGPALVARCRERLGVGIDFAGALPADPNVREAVARRRPAPRLFARSAFSLGIEALARRLLREEWEAPGAPGGRRPGHPDAPAPQPAPAPDAPASQAAAGAPPALPPLDLERPGAYLRRCRERLGLTLGEMTERTRIQGLAAIEGERFAALPPEPYLKGFLLSYARELGIPQLEALAASYLDRHRSAAGA